ncbi:MAG TPA: glycoside hydrolase family 3 N-terminal domain-containing protein, partial [Longimicrobium sp.]|uniref:glycoside hydrolase family 3 protein n=1 Tax=Longimicrobium sp. TaxID=2029185 RepID=UPI002EDAE1EC
QLVFPWISGKSPAQEPEEAARMLEWVGRGEVGGLIVSIGAPAEMAAKLHAAQRGARVPLLIVSDLETGPGMRLTPGGTSMPPAMAFGAADDEALAREAGRVTASEGRAVGIHLTFGPVLDVNSNPDNPIINVRSFGERPDRVGRLASAWIEGARAGGLLTVGKHFPGHGDTQVDSHVGLAAISADSGRLARVELVPFLAATGAGMDGMLVGHIAMQGIEGPNAAPATLSPRITTGLLRGQMGFRGIVFTDALNMGAVTRTYPVAEASILALLAGADALLQPPGHEEVIDSVVSAVQAGRIPAARVEEAARRILRAKAAAGLHRGPAAPGPAGRVGTPQHAEVAARVAERALVLVRDRTGAVPIRRAARVLHVTYTGRARSAGTALQRGLAAGGLAVEHVLVGPQTPEAVFDSLRVRAASADVIVASAAVAPVHNQELGIGGEFAAWVESLAAAGRPVIAVSMGSPYLLTGFPSVPAYLLSWDTGEASEGAAARALLGTAPIRGRLPVSLPPFHQVGTGLDRGEGGH